jgi:hypothetical protein
MAEYIKREAAVKSVLRMRKPENSVAQNRMLSIIQMDISKLPAADVAPVVHGVWACVNKIDPISGYRCSKCRRIVGFDLTPYCPNCGARMDGKDGGDNDAAD